MSITIYRRRAGGGPEIEIRAITVGADTLREAVIQLVRGGVDLSCAQLSGADLCGAPLAGARLAGADLCGACLRGVDLSGADLRGARLIRADLTGASLWYGDCSSADITSAQLSRADVSHAKLGGATVADAVLDGADLRHTELTSCDLRSADLSRIREDVRRVLASGDEVPSLLAAIKKGRIDGMQYHKTCPPNHDPAAELWARSIFIGDTPATSQIAAITEEWIVEWLADQ